MAFEASTGSSTLPPDRQIEHPDDARRREQARKVRTWRVEALHDAMVEADVTHAFVVFENGHFTLSHPKLLRPLRAFFELSHDFADHEGIFLGREPGIPTVFLAAVHDTRRGLAQGGLRFAPYDSVADMLTDGLRLAQGMTRKNALAGLWWGGGKGVVARTEALSNDPEYLIERSDKRLALFRAYGRFVASLGGVYYTAEDVGTKTSDMNALLGVNRFTTCVGAELGGSGNPSPYTARGVFRAMQAAWRFLAGTDDLAGVGVAVQGVGNVGGPLVDLLHGAGAKLWLTDIDTEALDRFQAKYPDVVIAGLDEIYDVPADVFAPCARGAVVNRDTIPRLRVRLVCGAANNVLRDPEDAERLRRRGIAYVPDYLCNRMGITNCCDEWQGYLPGDVALAAEHVYPDTLRVLRYARSQIITTAAAADQLADLAACELHPMMGHRGRRIVDRLIADGWHRPEAKRRSGLGLAPAFDPGADEPAIRVRWEHGGAFRGRGRSFASAPIGCSGRPDLSTLLSALLMDVHARAYELRSGDRPRRVVGSDPGGLALQLAVERSLPFEREDLGKARFYELCLDLQRRNDAAVREQLHQLGVGFDPQAWIDPMSRDTSRVVRRLFHSFSDAGRLRRERRQTFYDPSTQTVLVDPDVIRTRVEVDERFRIRFECPEGALEVVTFFPELLAGVCALVVRTGGPYESLAGGVVRDPLRSGETLPVLGLDSLATDAKFLVPAHDRDDFELAQGLGLRERGLAVDRQVLDDRGLVVLPGEPPLERAQARRLVVQTLGDAVDREEGTWWVDAYRARKSETLVNLGTSEQLFVDLSDGAARLRRAIESGQVTFSAPRWRRRALDHLEALDALGEPWCISRQYWWGHEMPDRPDNEMLSVWFSLAAWTLRATGWPEDPEPAPIDDVWVDAEFFEPWALLGQMVSLTVTGRPAFRHLHVHGTLHVSRGVLEASPNGEVAVGGLALDEERYVARRSRRPMRRRLGNAVEPATLIRRFGADALRLGYLLSLQSEDSDVATASESHLRRGRRSVQRIVSKVTGLFHRTRALDAAVEVETMGTPIPTVDVWLLGRCAALVSEASEAYEIDRLDRVGRRFAAAADELSRYADIAVARLDALEGDDAHGGVALAMARVVRRTVATALETLARGFEPVAPYLFDHLRRWTARRVDAWPDVPAEAASLAASLEALRGARGVRRLEVEPGMMADCIERDLGELERLVGEPLEVVRSDA